MTQVNQKIAELQQALEQGRMMTQQQMEAAQKAQEEYEDQKRKLDAANRDLGSKSPGYPHPRHQHDRERRRLERGAGPDLAHADRL